MKLRSTPSLPPRPPACLLSFFSEALRVTADESTYVSICLRGDTWARCALA